MAMSLDEIKQRKIAGDFNTVAAVIGISPQNVYLALHRVGSKHHSKVCETLEKIITAREQLINA